MRVKGQFLIMLKNGPAADGVQVIECDLQDNRPGNIRRARLKSVRRLLVSGFVETNV